MLCETEVDAYECVIPSNTLTLTNIIVGIISIVYIKSQGPLLGLVGITHSFKMMK